MYIRQAKKDDNTPLLELQARCPQGTTIIVSTVNTPDFFARAKVYEDFKVFVACEDDRIIGSAACALRKAIIDDQIIKIGYEFQAFVAPDFRGKRIAGQLHQAREDHLRKQGAMLSYGLIIEGNRPSIRHVERQGFKRYRTLVMPGISVFKEKEFNFRGSIRPIQRKDFPVIVSLINGTWQGYEFYEPITNETLDRLVTKTPGYGFDNVLVMEDNRKIVACVGMWDWSQLMRITVIAINNKMRALGVISSALRIFRPFPRAPRPGDILKQTALSPIGFEDPEYIPSLLKYVNNLAFKKGIQQFFFLCESGHPLLGSLKGFFHIDTAIHLYIKVLHDSLALSEKPVFMNPVDM